MKNYKSGSANHLTAEDFQREVSARAAENKITLPICVNIVGPLDESKYAGDLDAIYQRVDLDYRRNRGQFFTPPDVAEFMVRYGIEGGAKTILDPACGLGVFIDKMLEMNGTNRKIVAIDDDPSMINACYLNIRDRHGKRCGGVEFHNMDYLKSEDMNLVDFLVCNPPYINFHGFDRDIIRKVNVNFGVKFSMLTNIYALFMVKAKRSVKDGGRIAFITPSEFFYTGYGKTLKKFLLDNFTIDRFITFDFDSTVFDDALTTATISLMVNRKPERGHRVGFVRAGKKSIGSARANMVMQDKIDPDAKWQRYFEEYPVSEAVMDKLMPLGRMADVKRGIATGSNSFFTMSDSEREHWGIEDDFFVPVVSKAAQVRSYELTESDMTELGKNGDKIHLLYCFDPPSRKLRKYVEHGEREGVNDRYLCAHRSPWYSMEKREAAPILSTTFSRDNMRFIHNKAGCLNLAAYHGVYPHSDDVTMLEALLCYLNSDLCIAIQKLARREYGNGLHKFEPSDLTELPTMPMTDIGKKDIASMASLFRRLVRSGTRKDRAKEKMNRTVWKIASSL